jgi:hypothetical protein
MPAVRSAARPRTVEPSELLAHGNAVLGDLLVELALALLPRGITPKTFGELSRQAFARAGAKLSQRSNGKINHSRVAALTGLSRAEVKRLLRSADPASSTLRLTQMPIERVLQGWRGDRRFLDKQGNPKALRISGNSNSFALLTRLYGGDVPHRAILDELQRIGAVRRSSQVVTLRKRERPRFTSLISALPAIIDGIRIASISDGTRLPPAIYRLSIPAKSELELTLVRERCVSTVATMLSGLGESLGGQLTRAMTRHGGLRSFVVTVLLTEKKVQDDPQLVKRRDQIHPQSPASRVRKSSSVPQRN